MAKDSETASSNAGYTDGLIYPKKVKIDGAPGSSYTPADRFAEEPNEIPPGEGAIKPIDPPKEHEGMYGNPAYQFGHLVIEPKEACPATPRDQLCKPGALGARQGLTSYATAWPDANGPGE
jgi:hypothetical protein